MENDNDPERVRDQTTNIQANHSFKLITGLSDRNKPALGLDFTLSTSERLIISQSPTVNVYGQRLGGVQI